MIAISHRNPDKENCLESTFKSSHGSTNCYYYYNYPPVSWVVLSLEVKMSH